MSSPSSADTFAFIERGVGLGDHDDGPPRLSDTFNELTSGKVSSPFTQLLAKLRKEHPGYVVTFANPQNLNLVAFAAAGHATATLDTEDESLVRMRFWEQSSQRGGIGHLVDSTTFARYSFHWGREDFILYVVVIGFSAAQYILKERVPGEGQLSHSVVTDTLLAQVGQWQYKERKGVYVYDGYWYLDAKLYDQVQKASWDKVILDPDMKKDLSRVSRRFFDSKSVYEELGVPWKRGIIFYGPAGNGKTISVKALMHTLAERDNPVPTLYVKAAPNTMHIRNVFAMARREAPCMLVLEDIDTIVTSQTRSYFFNEVDGLENNDGILMIASTNHIDRLDPGLSKRPSRFDRKYLFPSPDKPERVEYVRFWRRKLSAKKDVDFPERLEVPIADITYGFSFAYMQEAFVATLLEMAHRRDEEEEEDDERADADEAYHNAAESPFRTLDDDDDDGLDKYELWRIIKEQVKTLRKEMGSDDPDARYENIGPVPPLNLESLESLSDIPHHQRRSQDCPAIPLNTAERQQGTDGLLGAVLGLRNLRVGPEPPSPDMGLFG
ncbi:P-loop containing nucleoside triphosphate hydrolase protein [Xylariomycetidae sp. FL2044]|nr:P-loop containing nucleoside triphosphate hydrolase protein [Xylariomycetidae sp. FL2044]